MDSVFYANDAWLAPCPQLTVRHLPIKKALLLWACRVMKEEPQVGSMRYQEDGECPHLARCRREGSDGVSSQALRLSEEAQPLAETAAGLAQRHRHHCVKSCVPVPAGE